MERRIQRWRHFHPMPAQFRTGCAVSGVSICFGRKRNIWSRILYAAINPVTRESTSLCGQDKWRDDRNHKRSGERLSGRWSGREDSGREGVLTSFSDSKTNSFLDKSQSNITANRRKNKIWQESKTGVYRNIFKECGYSEEEILKKEERNIWNTRWSEEERFYHENKCGHGIHGGHREIMISETEHVIANDSVRQDEPETEIWPLLMEMGTDVYIKDGRKNYFVWSCAVSGTKPGITPNREKYFAMALFFCFKRWGDGEGDFNYSSENQKSDFTGMCS